MILGSTFAIKNILPFRKTEKVKITIEFFIFELNLVPNFS